MSPARRTRENDAMIGRPISESHYVVYNVDTTEPIRVGLNHWATLQAAFNCGDRWLAKKDYVVIDIRTGIAIPRSAIHD